MNNTFKKILIFFSDIAARQRRENFDISEFENSEIENENIYCPKNIYCPNLSLIKEARTCPSHLVKRERIIEDEFYKAKTYDI